MVRLFVNEILIYLSYRKRELKRQAVEDADTEYKPEYEPRKRFRGRGEVV